MTYLKTIFSAFATVAAITAAPAPALANDADVILRVLNGLVANGHVVPRGDYRVRGWDDDDDDGFRTRGGHARSSWNDDDDDGYRTRSRNIGRNWNDDDDDGGRGHDDDD